MIFIKVLFKLMFFFISCLTDFIVLEILLILFLEKCLFCDFFIYKIEFRLLVFRYLLFFRLLKNDMITIIMY